MLSDTNLSIFPGTILSQICSGFPSDADDLWMERFHTLPWEERSKVLDGFEDSRYKELAERLVCVNNPESASSETLERYHNFINQRLYDKGPWPSLEKTLDKTRSMLLDATGEQKEILEKLEENLSKKSEIN